MPLPEEPERLVPMEDWAHKETGVPHVAFRMSESGDVTTASHKFDSGWYGTIQKFLVNFKKIREKLHLFL